MMLARRWAMCATRVTVEQPDRPAKVYEGRVPAPNAVQSVIVMDANADLYKVKHRLTVEPLNGANYARMTLVNDAGVRLPEVEYA